MGFDTINDLRSDALWLAGEEIGASVSPFYARALEYLDAVQDAIVTGGSLRNIIELPLEDWRWAKPQPRRTIALKASTQWSACTCAITQGGAAGTFSPALSATLAGYRLKIPNEKDVPQITVHASPFSAFTIDHAWVAASVSSTAWTAFQVEYQLPADCLRLSSGLILQGHGEFSVVDRRTLEDNFPFHLITEGNPQAAALVSEGWLRLSHYPADPGMVIEYDSIVRPDSLAGAADPSTAEPTIPKPFRRILSTGAAVLLLFDKGDGKHEEVFEQFQAIWLAMKKANSRPQHRAARGYGYIKPRLDQVQTKIRTTTSGLPVLW